MDQPPSPQTAASSPPAATDNTHWNPAKQRLFLIALLETGSVAAAARRVAMSRTSAHRLRRRLAGTIFDQSWTGALAQHAAYMADPFAPDRPPPAQAAAASSPPPARP